jgi:CysZ protein
MPQPSGFIAGFSLPLHAAALLARRRSRWPWAIAPLALNVALYVAVIALAVWLIDRWQVRVDWDFWGPVGGWLTAAVNSGAGLTKWLIALPVLFVACYFTFTAVGMIVASPLNDALSERAERAIVGERPDAVSGHGGAIGAMVGSVIDSAAIVGQQIGYSLAAMPFLLVPVIGALPLLYINAWFTGRELVTIAAARHRLRRRHIRPVLARRRPQVLGLGVAVVMLFAVPFAGLLLLPVAVVAGTMLHCGIDWRAELAAAGVEPPAGFEPAAADR